MSMHKMTYHLKATIKELENSVKNFVFNIKLWISLTCPLTWGVTGIPLAGLSLVGVSLVGVSWVGVSLVGVSLWGVWLSLRAPWSWSLSSGTESSSPCPTVPSSSMEHSIRWDTAVSEGSSALWDSSASSSSSSLPMLQGQEVVNVNLLMHHVW